MGDESNEFHREVVRPKVTELLSPNPADYILDKKLCQYRYIQSLSHHLVHILPQKLHHEDKETDEEGAREQQAETFQNKYV